MQQDGNSDNSNKRNGSKSNTRKYGSDGNNDKSGLTATTVTTKTPKKLVFPESVSEGFSLSRYYTGEKLHHRLECVPANR